MLFVSVYLFFNSSSAAAAKLLQSCPTLCDPIDSSSPGSPDPGILQARTLERGAIAFSRNTLEGIKSRISEAEERISELEDKMVEIDSEEQNKVKRMKRTG